MLLLLAIAAAAADAGTAEGSAAYR
jgi:hypothetical protein